MNSQAAIASEAADGAPQGASRVTVARKARFSSAHFLALPECSPEENFRRFGPSSNPLAHGHNRHRNLLAWH